MDAPDNATPIVDGPPASGPQDTANQNSQGYLDAAKNHMVQPETPTANPTTIPDQMATRQSPTVITPMPHTGVRGVIDKALDSIAGTHGVKLAQDNDGNLYIQHPALSRGQQYLKIGMLALRGAGAGLAAGRGAGNKGKALLAGINQGDQQNQQEDDQEKDYKLQVANSQALTHQAVADQLKATREQITFDRGTADYYDKKFSEATAPGPNGEPGGTFLGKVNSLGDLAKLMKENPDAINQQVQHGDIVAVPSFDSEGKADGFRAVLRAPGWGNNELPSGTSFYIAVPDPAHPGLFMRKEEKTSGPATARQIAAYNDAADNKIQNATIAKTKADEAERLKNAQIHADNVRADSEEKKLPHEINHIDAETNAANARAAKTRSGETNADGTPNPTFEAMAQAVYNGDILPKDLKREAKGAALDPNAIMGRAVEMGLANGKPWSASTIEQEHSFASNVKVQAAIDGIDRIISPGSGYMQLMMDQAKAANLGPVGAINSAVLAARRGYGEKTAKNLETSIAETRRSVAGLIGNPLLGGGETDKKLEQAKDLLGKAPTMENLQSAADLITSALGTQRQSMVQNNRFLAKRFGATPGGSSQPATPQAAAPKPAGQPQFQAVSSDGKWGWDGKTWVSTGK